tara:strand:- start:327766 stop:328344 length:579 start_codon:yes stop_codon:yes gene_type:complete
MKTTTINNKKMTSKKLIIAVALAMLPIFTFAQSVFDKFEDMDDVSTVVVNKRAFDLMSRVGAGSPEAKEYVDMVKSLKSLRVFATEKASIATDMKAVVESYLKTAKLSELMRVKDKEGNVKIYIREGKDKDHVSELFMFIEGISQHVGGDDRKPEAVIVSITGDINLNKISELTSQMNIQGGEHLKNVGKKQ